MHRLIWLLVFISCPIFAASRERVLMKEGVLYASANLESAMLGTLPEGSIVELLPRGEDEDPGPLVRVQVELEGSQSIKGWVKRSLLRPLPRDQSVTQEEDSSSPSGEGLRTRRARIKIPKDEALLLRRESTFFYGFSGGANLGLLQSSTTDYADVGFQVGLLAGTYLYSFFPVEVELGYLIGRGTGASAQSINLGFVDMGVSGLYVFEPVEFSLGLKYLFGASSGLMPNEVRVNSVQDLSSAYLQAGLGYQWKFGTLALCTTRLRYLFSLIQQPLAFQFFQLSIVLAFLG